MRLCLDLAGDCVLGGGRRRGRPAVETVNSSVGIAHGVAGEDQGLAVGGGSGGIIEAADDFHGLAAGDRDDVDGRVAGVLGGEVELGGIRRPSDGLHPAVEVFGEVGDFAGGALDELQAEAVALVPGAELGADGDVFSVGRVERRGVRAVVGRGEVYGPGLRVGEREGEDIAIGRCGLDLVKIGGEGDLAAVGRELVLVLPAEGKGRHVVIAGSKVAGGAGSCRGEQAALMRNRCERLPLS